VWILILIAVHINDPNDQPGRIEMLFPDQMSCEDSLQSMTYWLKFSQFKIDGRCIKK
jgi:hypothetical protein